MALTILDFRFSIFDGARRIRYALGALLCLLLLISNAHAQDDGTPQQDDGTPQQVQINPKAPIFWADNITQIADLDAYQRVGFNTVVVRLTWSTADNGEITAQNLAPQRQFAEAAAKRGLKVIYALPAAPSGLDGTFRLSADSDAYVSLWTTWLQDAMAALKDTPNLIGWMLPDDPRGLPLFDDVGFQRWLSQNYADISVINRQWNSKFNSVDDIGISDVSKLTDDWQGNGTPTDDEINSGKMAITHAAYGQDWAFHPAGLSLAHYKWDAYRALLTAWVGAVRGEDSTHLVFSGRTPDYAQLLSLPSGIDVATPDVQPGVAEDDIVTHNPQAIDIARRGGKFGVLPMLSSSPSTQLPAGAFADLTRGWIEEAWSRGARGLGFDSWITLRQVPGLPAAINDEIDKLTTPINAGLWGQAPINTTAVLLTPLADGATLQFGTPPNQYPRGLYGFGDDLVNSEPSNLVWMMRWGTAFGGVDYLSPDDLTDTPLDRYTTILAPQTLSATNDTITQLTSYVGNGGVLVGDLGMGALQNGGQVNALPPPLAALFGLPGSFDVRRISFNLSGVSGHSLFPTWSNLIGSRPGVTLTLGDGPNNTAFNGPAGFSTVDPTAQILATGPRIGQQVGPMNRISSTQFTVNSVGKGYALFAPFRLWSYWRPGEAGFDTCFGELMSRGATVVMAGATSMVPSPATMKVGMTLYPEIVNRASGIMLTNHSAPGANSQLTAVQTSGAGDWLWSGGLTHFPLKADFPVGGRSAPVDIASELESRPHAVALYASVAPGQTLSMSMRPIAVQNISGGPLAGQIQDEKPEQLKINLWPNCASVVAAPLEWRSAIGEPAPVRVTIVSSQDGYNFAPGSKHRAVIVDYAKPAGKNRFLTTEQTAVASPDGRIVFQFSGASCEMTVTPAPAAETKGKR